MASAIRNCDNGESNVGASRTHHETRHDPTGESPQETAPDYYSILLKAIAEASSDPARLRKLVYALACHNLNPDMVLAGPIPDATRQARTILELEQALQLERAIKRLESQSTPPADVPHPAGQDRSLSELSDDARPDRRPGWLDAAGPIGMLAEAPIQGSYAMRLSIASLLQVGAATAIGVSCFVGIFAWMQWVRPMPTLIGRSAPPLVVPGENLPDVADTVGSAQPPGIESPATLQSGLPFPLPASYGVYAGRDSQLIELEPLPVEVPTSRARVSAEITKPSRATLPGHKLAFVVFRQNLADDIPAAVSARVVGRVSRALTFGDFRAKVTPLESSWRIRDKSYEFKVSPIEGNREMFVVQPDGVLPAGRYALVLNGYGYDFTVAGPITAPEQCLEQTQLTNGVLVTECPRS